MIAGLALALAGGGSYAVAELTAEPPPTNYEGTYGLFLSGSLAGPIHAFKGCTTDLETNLSDEETPEGEVERQIPRRQVPVACEIEVGLGMSLGFRTVVSRALRGESEVLDFAIGRARADGTIASELRFRGYVSDVTLPTLRAGPDLEASWMRVELVSETGTVRKVLNPGTRVTGVHEPIDASKPKFELTGVDPLGLQQLDPLSLTRADIPVRNPATGDIIYSSPPGKPRVASPQLLRVRESAPKTVNAVAGWFEQQLVTDAPISRTLTVGYQDANARRSLTLSLTGIPTHFDPYERTDGRRVLRLAVDPEVESIEWR